MKIAIAGQMASGKTTLANNLQQELEDLDYRVARHSLGFKVKQIGTDLFGMTDKDRPLLQKIGMKMREIREEVWIEYVNRSIEEDLAADKYDVAIVDDVRFVNEAKFFHNQDWFTIRLNIGEELQQERLQKTYDNWEVHWDNRQDPSETEVAQIPSESLSMDMIADDSDNTLIHVLSYLETFGCFQG